MGVTHGLGVAFVGLAQVGSMTTVPDPLSISSWLCRMGVGQALIDSPPASIQKAVQCVWLAKIAMNKYKRNYDLDSLLLIDL